MKGDKYIVKAYYNLEQPIAEVFYETETYIYYIWVSNLNGVDAWYLNKIMGVSKMLAKERWNTWEQV